jgi:hypothetical protein
MEKEFNPELAKSQVFILNELLKEREEHKALTESEGAVLEWLVLTWSMKLTLIEESIERIQKAIERHEEI